MKSNWIVPRFIEKNIFDKKKMQEVQIIIRYLYKKF